MSVKGLPDIDVPFFNMGENPCRDCVHYYYQSNDRDLRYPRCGRAQYAQQCRYERDPEGGCGPDGKHFKRRSI